MHLATRIPPLAQMRKLANWRDNDRLRSQGASVLVNAALAAKARIYVQESITFLYQGLGDTQLFETAPIDAPQPLASARDAERETARFSARGGQGVVLRFGHLLRRRGSVDARNGRARAAAALSRSSAPATTTCRRSTSTTPPPRRSRPCKPRPGSTTSSTTSPCRCASTSRRSPRRSASARPATCPLWLARLVLGPAIEASHQVAARQQHHVQSGHQLVAALSERSPGLARGRRGAEAAEISLTDRTGSDYVRIKVAVACPYVNPSTPFEEEASPMRSRVLLYAFAAVAFAAPALTVPTVRRRYVSGQQMRRRQAQGRELQLQGRARARGASSSAAAAPTPRARRGASARPPTR